MDMKTIATELLTRFLGSARRNIRIYPEPSLAEGISTFDINVTSLHFDFQEIIEGMRHLYRIVETMKLPHDNENYYNESYTIHITRFPDNQDIANANNCYRVIPVNTEFKDVIEDETSQYAAILDIIFILPSGDDIDSCCGEIHGELHIGLPDAIDAQVDHVLKERRFRNFRAWQRTTIEGIENMLNLMVRCPEIERMGKTDLSAQANQKLNLMLLLLSAKVSHWMEETN